MDAVKSQRKPIPPASKKVGWENFLSQLPRWDRILAAGSVSVVDVVAPCKAHRWAPALPVAIYLVTLNT